MTLALEYAGNLSMLKHVLAVGNFSFGLSVSIIEIVKAG